MEILKSLLSTKRKLTDLPQPLVVEDMIELFEVFYVCFDEPNRAENWKEILEIIPRAKKVEGVVGFDNALKACASQSKTDYFFLIDGDNKLVPERFSNTVEIPEIKDHWVLSWSSYNPVNGLSYGNGGLKLWPKHVALNINTHENAESEDDQTDYCFIADYYLVDDFVTETVINVTPVQAFRAGFREGVKMSLSWGKQVKLTDQNFDQALARQNRLRLKAWCELGNDSINGCWAILGARLGLMKNAIENFDYSAINSYEWIDKYFIGEVLPRLELSLEPIESLNWKRSGLTKFLKEIGEVINRNLPIDLQEVSPKESLEIKRDFRNPSRAGLLGRTPRRKDNFLK